MNIDINIQSTGKWHGILTSLGIDAESLVNKHCICPLCERKKFRFDNKEGKGTFICTCMAGDGVKLAMAFLGMNFKDTCVEIRKIIGEVKMETIKTVDNEKEIRQNRERLKRIASGCIPITPDTLAAKYFASRGLKVLPDHNCKFHPGIPYFDNNEKVGVFPAIVSIVMDAEGKPATFHVTYLNNDGHKLDCSTPKKLLPKTREWKGGCIRLFEPNEILGIAEGIETCLAAYQLDGYPMWATVTAGAMENLIIPKSVKNVVIYVDEDKSFTGQKAAYILARRLKVQEGKEVHVIRLIGDEMIPYIDKGMDIDFLDYVNKSIITDRKQI